MTRPLRVLIDARMLIGRFSGVGRFVTRLVERLAARPDVRVVTLCGDREYPAWRGRGDIEVLASSFGPGDRTPARRVWWEERHLPACIDKANVDLFHATWNTGVPARCPVPAVLTIHDLISWRAPKGTPAARVQRIAQRYALRASARRAAAITTVSDYVRDDVLRELGVPADRVVTVFNGVDGPSDGIPEPEPGREPYALYVGGHEPRKNVAAVLAAMDALWWRHDEPLSIRLTGRVESLAPDARAVYAGMANRSRVVFLGDVDDAELTRQYRGARLLLMLSREEGFGLPVLEAMAHGCPVIASNRMSLPEVVGGAGVVIAADDVTGVAAAIHRMLHEPGRRDRYVRLGLARARSFGWQRTAESMMAVYRRARHSRGGARRIAVREYADPPTPMTRRPAESRSHIVGA